jgi:hypothetical protein
MASLQLRRYIANQVSLEWKRLIGDSKTSPNRAGIRHKAAVEMRIRNSGAFAFLVAPHHNMPSAMVSKPKNTDTAMRSQNNFDRFVTGESGVEASAAIASSYHPDRCSQYRGDQRSNDEHGAKGETTGNEVSYRY